MSSVSVSVSASAPPRSESYVVKALLSGSVCAFVAALVNPLDVVKIRMQNQSLSSPWPEKTMISGLIRIYRDEGIRGWCRGVNASILRELFYSSIRIGAYEPILLLLSKGNDELPSPAAKFASGLLSGGIGSALGNPTDLVKINFQALLPGGTHRTEQHSGLLRIYLSLKAYQGCIKVGLSRQRDQQFLPQLKWEATIASKITFFGSTWVCKMGTHYI
mmetsp:Transcript_18318/g.26714  ORF Transcript_18318/g.26714 Transcript_18318/m.26714 type:complete len:218 (+) Transcript_18318:159-812(+)|eukprot:CAMPEP_0185040082 /NCGR_PEP_ID=MMETSP1103-20130426/37709_1 /TAXON_ID=36769 /ORGANISM="Paraphysomonas bandaiensis, Strain Caron Lab Isolate" /LENGTH=217 /DNA_ID=CAMNT_0027579237 /DNA_START=161 /DNA_END=814 /DNA_ORIENTATION=-